MIDLTAWLVRSREGYRRVRARAALHRIQEWRRQARIDQAAAAFLEEYLGHLPEAAKTLGCYWASFSFHRYLGVMKKRATKRAGPGRS